MTRMWMVALSAVAAISVVGVSEAATAGWRVIGTARASGEFAVAAANGSAKRPGAIAVRVTGGGSGVSGLGVVACTRGIASIGSTSTSFKGHFATLKMPMRNSNSCDVTASASGSGSLKIEILAR